jgi:MinD-like ATPase involved in chromosome partitioning or flagellar assembly
MPAVDTTHPDANLSLPNGICFLSGKGGAGKTSVSLALAVILSNMGKRVLFIDWDLNTHGASYFFTDAIESQRKQGILEAIRSTFPLQEDAGPFTAQFVEAMRVEVNDKLFFIPSKTQFKDKTWEISENDMLVSRFMRSAMQTIKLLDYDYVICDTQAGPIHAVQSLTQMCKRAVIISEPDPISIAASKSLDYEMHDHLSPTVKFLVNKLSTEEVKSFRAIRHYLTVFEHLSPLPFDFSVREAFSLRQIPVNLARPTPFLFSMIGFVREVYSQLGADCDAIEKTLKGRLLGDIKAKKSQYEESAVKLTQVLQVLEQEQIHYDKYTRQRTAILASIMIAMMTVILTGFFVLNRGGSRAISAFTETAVVMGTLGSVAPLFWEKLRSKFTGRTRQIQSQIETVREELNRLNTQRDRYETMLLETTQKYMIESKD